MKNARTKARMGRMNEKTNTGCRERKKAYACSGRSTRDERRDRFKNNETAMRHVSVYALNVHTMLISFPTPPIPSLRSSLPFLYVAFVMFATAFRIVRARAPSHRRRCSINSANRTCNERGRTGAGCCGGDGPVSHTSAVNVLASITSITRFQ